MSPVLEEKKNPKKSFLQRAFRLVALFGLLSFWGGILMAARQYPSEYDWRYMPVSNLLSASRNPIGYLWASTGTVLWSICGLAWTALLREGWNQRWAGGSSSGMRVLQFGNICLICAVMVPRRLLLVQKGHEILAVLAFAGLCLGMVLLMFHPVERSLLRRMRRFSAHTRLYAALLAGAAVLPIVLAGLAQAYVHFVLPELPWVNLSWRDRGVPAYLSLAFWEWITCLVLSFYIAVLSLATGKVCSARGRSEKKGNLS